jgi:hypothetical protein
VRAAGAAAAYPTRDGLNGQRYGHRYERAGDDRRDAEGVLSGPGQPSVGGAEGYRADEGAAGEVFGYAWHVPSMGEM